MLKDKKYAWYMALKAKDVRFDGRFFCRGIIYKGILPSSM